MAKPTAAIVPFVKAGHSGSQSAYQDVARKMATQLKGRDFRIVPLSGAGKSTQKLPGLQAYKSGLSLFKEGKNLSRQKKYEKAKSKLALALEKLEEGLLHVKDFEQILDLYRLLALNYFRLGENEKGEQAIQRMGFLSPKRQYAQSKLLPVFRRILKRAQKQATRGSGTVQIKFPEGAKVVFNEQTLSGDSPQSVKNLPPGKHYIWVTKKGFIPYAKPVEVKESGTTKVKATLTKLKKSSGGADFTAASMQIQQRLKQKTLDGQVKRQCKNIAQGLDVPYLLLGYFTREETSYKLSVFIYRRANEDLKTSPPISFDLELLEVDIKLLSAVQKMAKSWSKIASLPGRAWDKAKAAPAPRPAAVAVAARPAPRREAPAARPVARPAARPTARPAGRTAPEDDPDLDDFDPDAYAKKRGLKNTVKPGTRPAPRREAAPPPRREEPAPRREAPPARREEPAPRQAPPARRVEPAPRREAPPARRESTTPDDPDDPDLDTAPKKRPKPRVRVPDPPKVNINQTPTARREAPAPRRVAAVPVRTRPARATRREPIRRELPLTSTAKRVALVDAERAKRSNPNFDPDVHINWKAHPVPRAAREGRSARYVPTPRRTEPTRTPTPPARTRPAPVEPDDPDDPPVTRRATPVRREPPRREPPKRITPARREPPPARPTGPSVPLTQRWWFWAAIGGVGVAAVATTTTLIIINQPASAYDVVVQVNPPQ